MSNVTITQLPVVTSVSSSDVIPVVASGVTSQISSANFGNSLTVATASYAFTSIASTVANSATNATYALTASNVTPLSQSVIVSGSVNIVSTGQTAFSSIGNQNGYIEFSMRNASTGVSASGDIAVYGDQGTVLNNYIDMGINNSGMSPTYYYGGANFGGAYDAYLYNAGGNLRIGNANAATTSQSLFLFSNPTATPDLTITSSRLAVGSNFTNPQYTLDVSGSGNINNGLTVTGSLLHSGSNIFTGSLFVTGAVVLNGSNLSNVITFPYTGSAVISGSLTVIGNIVGSNSSSYIGNLAGANATATSYSVFLGEQAGLGSVYSANSVLAGAFAGFNAFSSSYLTAVGYSAGISASFAANATIFGPYAGYGASQAVGSAFHGIYAGAGAVSSSYSTFIGPYAGYQMSGSSYSIAVGYNTGFASKLGSGNIIIGTNVTLASGSASSINIGGLIFASGAYFSTSSVSSGSANGNVGINQPNPTYNLDVVGSGNYSNGLNVTGSHNISGSISATNTIVLPKVSSSYNFINDAAAAAGGIPLGGLYRSGSLILIRLA